MPELKYNTTQYEIFYLKNRRLFIIVAIIATIILIAFTFWLLQTIGLINNNDLKDVKYTIQDIQPNEKYSILSNHELVQYKPDGVVKLNVKNNNTSTIALIDDKSEIVAINDNYNSNFKFNYASTFATLISNSPYYIFLDNDTKKLLRTELDKKDYVPVINKLKSSTLAKVIQTQEYLDLLNNTNKDPEINKIVKNYYAKLNQTTLPGYTNTNKTYPFSIQLDNYVASYPGKFTSTFGLDIINEKSIPRLENHATFYQNLDLTEKNKTSSNALVESVQNTYNITQLVTPTFYSKNITTNANQLEELKLPSNFPEVINEYNLNSKQISGDANIPNAISYNLSKYMGYAFNTITSKNIVRATENFDQISETYVKECLPGYKTPLDVLICYQQKLYTNINSRFVLEKNNSTDNLIKILKDLYIGQLTLDTQFNTSDTTSPEASFLHFLRGNDPTPGSIKLKPPFLALSSKFGGYNIQYDASFETASEDNTDKALKVVFNQRNILVTFEYNYAEKTQYFCTNDIDVAKLDNTLYKSFDPKWENGKLELKPEVVNYYKTDNRYFQNLKNDLPAALKEVSEADSSTFKNCFNAANLGTLFNGNLVKIQAKKQDNTKFTEEETQLTDKFITTLVIDKK
jgi:hypothetical protein